MTETSDRQPLSHTPDSQQALDANRHYSLLFAAAILTSGVAIVAGIYGIRANLLTIKVLALQTTLAAIASWFCLNACRIRIRHARQATEGPVDSDTPHQPQWGQDQYYEEEVSHDVIMGDLEHSRKLHYLFLAAIPTAFVGLLTTFQAWSQSGASLDAIDQSQAVVLGIVCLGASCVWLVMTRSFAAIDKEELPDGPGLALTFRETQWTAILVSAAIVGSLAWAPLRTWVGWGLLAWVMLVSIEQCVRILNAWLRPKTEAEPFLPPLCSVLREAILVVGNPITSVFQMIETRFGVSFRSSWAIQFVKRAAVPMVLLALFLFWGLSSLSMVGPSEMGICENFGRISGEPLQPGLHLKVPWPFGRVIRYPVKKISCMPIGFQVEETDMPVAEFKIPRAFLWSKVHASKEFPLVLGNGTEVVAVNVLLFYKIRDDKQGFMDYVYNFQNPEVALQGYAYRALMEETRSTTLKNVLSTNRAAFAKSLEDSLRNYSTKNHLGIDVIDVALVNLHPPIEVAPSYLDVISARIDANRAEVQAAGDTSIKTLRAEAESTSAIATASINADKRVSTANEESSRFVATGKAFAVAPESFKLRLRGDTVEEILSSKPLIVIDKSFVDGEGEMLLDLRPNSRSVDSLINGERRR